MKKTVNIREARAHFSRRLVCWTKGEEIIIAKVRKPVAGLIPYRELPADRKPGTAEGQVRISPGFHRPLRDEIVNSFRG
jgi:antitoxin (DNA-binding transcriptional repressor) of toxin-antitoxin stability system